MVDMPSNQPRLSDKSSSSYGFRNVWEFYFIVRGKLRKQNLLFFILWDTHPGGHGLEFIFCNPLRRGKTQPILNKRAVLKIILKFDRWWGWSSGARGYVGSLLRYHYSQVHLDSVKISAIGQEDLFENYKFWNFITVCQLFVLASFTLFYACYLPFYSSTHCHFYISWLWM